MRFSSLFIAFACLAAGAAPALAVDLSKIERTLVKEPAYRSKNPRYALLVFGPEAKLRAWVVLDGKEVYLDRNGDGDLTGPGERFKEHAECRNIELADPDGRTRYLVTDIFIDGDDSRTFLHVNVAIKGPTAYQQYVDCVMNFRYAVSLYQMEYSRNFLLERGRDLERMFQGLIDRTRSTLDLKTVKTILGCKQRPQKKSKARWEITVETPEYGLTIFKVHAGALTLKMYTKGEHVLRCEVIVHNVRKLKHGNGLARWVAVVTHWNEVLDRFLEVVQCADSATLDDGTWESLPEPSAVGAGRVAGINLASERMTAVRDAVVALSTPPGGFTSGDLAVKVQERLGVSAADYQPRQAAYDLKKLRGKKLVAKIGKSRIYEAPAEGLRTLVALGLLRDKVLKPVLRNRNLQGPPPRSNNPLDHHYYNLRQEMRRLFRTLKIAG